MEITVKQILSLMDKKERKAVVWMVIYIVSACVIALAFTSCKTKVVTTERVHNVYHNVVDTIRDSISHEVYVYQYIKGDTIYNNKTEKVYVDRWRIRDSIIFQLDSIPYPVEVIKEVKKPTPIWHYIVVFAAILVLLFNLYKKFLQ